MRGTSDSTSCAFADNGSFDVTGRIMDKDDGFDEWATTVTVNNVAPTLNAINVDTALVPVNTAINASADFTDPGTLDMHTASWDWGDGTTVGTITQGAGSGSVNGSHSYSVPGVYTVKLIVTDSDLADSNEEVYQYVVVYDPTGGFVTGGGWIDSPADACPTGSICEGASGRANFGFVSKYEKGASTPAGDTNFQFKAGDLHFKSTSYEWLVIAGANAKYMGEGTINGTGSYGFMLTATDSDVQGGGDFDAFRIRIWNLGSGGGTVYDNQHGQDVNGEAGTVLGGGNIKIHKAK